MDNVSVDRHFARFGGKSYAIDKINSVEVRERRPHGEAAVATLGIFAVIFWIAFLGNVHGSLEWSAFFLALAIVSCLLTYQAWKRCSIIEYQLFLMTSSSEVEAIASQDGSIIRALRDRIELAMTGQLDDTFPSG